MTLRDLRERRGLRKGHTKVTPKRLRAAADKGGGGVSVRGWLGSEGLAAGSNVGKVGATVRPATSLGVIAPVTVISP